MKRYSHLNQGERVLTSYYHDNGMSICQIAHDLGRSKSTISREIGHIQSKRSAS